MRLFFALPLPEPLLASLADWQERARRAGLAAAYPRPGGLHLTLAFLGSVAEERLGELGRAAAGAAAGSAPFPLRSSILGVFPPRVVWLGLEPSAPLERLQGGLARALEPLGFPPEARPFAPHLTLARPKGKGRLPLPMAPPPFEWTVSEFALYESVAAPGGRRYEIRGGWRFSGSPPLR